MVRITGIAEAATEERGMEPGGESSAGEQVLVLLLQQAGVQSSDDHPGSTTTLNGATREGHLSTTLTTPPSFAQPTAATTPTVIPAPSWLSVFQTSHSLAHQVLLHAPRTRLTLDCSAGSSGDSKGPQGSSSSGGGGKGSQGCSSGGGDKMAECSSRGHAFAMQLAALAPAVSLVMRGGLCAPDPHLSPQVTSLMLQDTPLTAHSLTTLSAQLLWGTNIHELALLRCNLTDVTATAASAHCFPYVLQLNVAHCHAYSGPTPSSSGLGAALSLIDPSKLQGLIADTPDTCSAAVRLPALQRLELHTHGRPVENLTRLLTHPSLVDVTLRYLAYVRYLRYTDQLCDWSRCRWRRLCLWDCADTQLLPALPRGITVVRGKLTVVRRTVPLEAEGKLVLEPAPVSTTPGWGHPGGSGSRGDGGRGDGGGGGGCSGSDDGNGVGAFSSRSGAGGGSSSSENGGSDNGFSGSGSDGGSSGTSSLPARWPQVAFELNGGHTYNREAYADVQASYCDDYSYVQYAGRTPVTSAGELRRRERQFWHACQEQQRTAIQFVCSRLTDQQPCVLILTDFDWSWRLLEALRHTPPSITHVSFRQAGACCCGHLRMTSGQPPAAAAAAAATAAAAAAAAASADGAMTADGTVQGLLMGCLPAHVTNVQVNGRVYEWQADGRSGSSASGRGGDAEDGDVGGSSGRGGDVGGSSGRGGDVGGSSSRGGGNSCGYSGGGSSEGGSVGDGDSSSANGSGSSSGSTSGSGNGSDSSGGDRRGA